MPWKTSCPKEQRYEFAAEWQRHERPLVEQCRRWGISRKTAYKWIKRFELEGRGGLGDKPTAAKKVNNRPSDVWLARIRRWRTKHPSWGAPKLHWALKKRFGPQNLPSRSAMSRWLKRWELSGKRRGSSRRGPVIERPMLSTASQPNEVWTVDFKGWFRTTDGTRIDPLTVRDLASRFILAVVLMRQQTILECRKAFERIFLLYGLPRVIRVDNGSPFGAYGALGLTRLSAWWVKLGIRVEFIQPAHPEQNGAHEQMHRIYKAETLQPVARTFRAQNRRSQQWKEEYNYHRPHEGIGMRTPAEIYRKSRRKLPKKIKPWTYPKSWSNRLVKGKGMISWKGRGRYIGEAFERERIGLMRGGPGAWKVYFGPHLIGELRDDEMGAIHAVWFGKGKRK